MSIRRVYVDFDDVLCETAHTFLEVVEREFGRRYAFEEIVHFNLEESFHLNPEEHDYLMGLIHSPKLLRRMDPLPGAQAVLDRWKHSGIEISIVTGRPPETQAVCHEWLNTHRFPYHNLLFVDKYGRIPSHQVGTDVLVPQALIEMDFCMAVEDAPAMLSFIAEQTTIPLAILDRPWNRRITFDEPRGSVVRCQDWEAVGRCL